MPGPAPKHPSARARRNKSSTASTLRAVPDMPAPDLPEYREWHVATVEWWLDLWASPMAPEYDQSDRHGLVRVAVLLDDFWKAETPKERAEIQVRLEKADADYGTNPMARRRLQWEIERTEEAREKATQRRGGSSPKKKAAGGSDPRAVLRAT